MSLRSFVLIFLTFVLCASFVAGQSFTEELLQAPKCAITCGLDALSTTDCSLSNATCICNDVHYNSVVTQCVAKTCSAREALEAQHVISQACHVPVRDTSSTVLGIAIAFLIPSLIVVGIRLYLRARGKYGADDIFITLAAALCIPVTATVFILVKNGLGKDIWGVDADSISPLLYWYLIAEVLYITITGFTKLSILCFYLRVFPDVQLRRNTYIAMAVIAASLITFIFGAIFQCIPVSFTWEGWDGQRPGHCIDVPALLYSQATINIVMDIPVMLIPIPTLLELTLPRGRKLGLIAIFSLGILTTIVSILRFQGLVEFQHRQTNLTYQLAAPGYWSLIEIHVGILCVCLPTIRPFFRAIAPRLCGSQVGSSYDDYDNSAYPRPVRRVAQRISVDSERIGVTSNMDSTSNSDTTELGVVHKAHSDGSFSFQATKPLE